MAQRRVWSPLLVTNACSRRNGKRNPGCYAGGQQPKTIEPAYRVCTPAETAWPLSVRTVVEQLVKPASTITALSMESKNVRITLFLIRKTFRRCACHGKCGGELAAIQLAAFIYRQRVDEENAFWRLPAAEVSATMVEQHLL